ncbi:MAG TPA: proton-conducting transporter membrane subunit [Micromonosporaceae bacterium]|nr:proton-conducting transporter membrane subunit [Micromonosporaceae bacterium]
MTQPIDHVALLPAYLASGTAILVLLVDLAVARRTVTAAMAAMGAAATTCGAFAVGWSGGPRGTFCGDDGCSYVFGPRAALVAAVFALLTLAVLALSGPLLRAGQAPAGEYCFLLACSMTGGVVVGAAADLITLIVALETLTLPLYVLVGLRRASRASAEGAVTFFVVSVVATTITLLGAALLYAVTGAVHLSRLGQMLDGTSPLLDVPLTAVGTVLVVVGLGFKVAAVPLHAWAPVTYDGAPVPVAAYLSTASKLGGVVALLAVVQKPLPPAVTGPVLALLAVLTMTVGNLVALRQTRMVRLLAWSSVAQAGYILAPLGALTLVAEGGIDQVGAVRAALAYAVFFVVIEVAAFGAVIALRPAGADGGLIDDYRAAARRHRWVGAAFALALVGLAGLPPGLAGLFAKVTVVRSLLADGAGWLAVVVALNAVVGLAYYVRVAATLYAPTPATRPAPRPSWTVAAALAGATAVAVLVGFAPQVVLDAVAG